MKKILISFLAVTILCSSFFLPVKTADATGILTLDISNLFQDILQNFILPALGSALKKQILDRVVDQIIASIQGGGKPQFVTDWQGFLTDAGQGAAGIFANQLGAGFLCSPFSLQIQVSLLPVRKFSQQAQCTLSQIVKNVQAFYGDFRNGGWIAFGSSWQPQNNFTGALLMAAEKLDIVKANAEAAKYNEAMAGRGWLGTKDKNGNIVTPGSAVGDVVSKALGSGIDFVVSGQDIGSYAAAIINAMINRVFTIGLAKVAPTTTQQQTAAAAAAYERTIVANAFNGERTAVLGDINGTLTPRTQAQSLIDSTIANLKTYKTDLARISSALTATGRSICSGTLVVADVQTQIAAETAAIDPEISQLTAAGAANQPIIGPLQSAVNEINQMTPTRDAINRMEAIDGEVFPLLNSDAADAFLASTQATTTPINQNISAKTTLFNQDLQRCQ